MADVPEWAHAAAKRIAQEVTEGGITPAAFAQIIADAFAPHDCERLLRELADDVHVLNMVRYMRNGDSQGPWRMAAKKIKGGAVCGFTIPAAVQAAREAMK